MGHIGFTPQHKTKFRVEGNSKLKAKKLLKEALKIEKAGAFSIVLECVSSKAAKEITSKLKIPTIGIGSSSYCDGQILVTDDMLGLTESKIKFVKKYIDLKKNIRQAVKKFKLDVKKSSYPSIKYSY